jgi:hypothetical protein
MSVMVHDDGVDVVLALEAGGGYTGVVGDVGVGVRWKIF